MINKVKVLVIDDDEALDRLIIHALESTGYEAGYVTSLDDIDAVLIQTKPTVILMDVELGNRNGIEVAKQIVKQSPHIPILFISSYTESEKVIKALEAGGRVYLRKPLSMEELIAYIKRYSHKMAPRHCVSIGAFTFNANKNLLYHREHEVLINLPPNESKLLQLLIKNRGQTVNKDVINEVIWKNEKLDYNHNLHNLVYNLRKYLSADPTLRIVSISKKGYMLFSRDR